MFKIAAVGLLCLISSALSADTCSTDVTLECNQSSDSMNLAGCNAIFGGYGEHSAVATDMRAYTMMHLEHSFNFLLLSSYYNNYKMNRDGFSKLFRKMSDDTWKKSIELIKHITMRGDKMDFSHHNFQKNEAKSFTAELRELESLAEALDIQKQLAERAFHIHREATRNNEQLHDAETAHYLEEEFIEDQAKSIRALAGYTSDIRHFIAKDSGNDLSISLYLFDEYLQKTV